MNNDPRRLGYASATVAVGAWGINTVLLKLLTGRLGLDLLNASRILCATLMFLGVLWFLRRHATTFLPRLPWRTWLGIALVGFVGTSLYQWLFVRGIELTSASITALTSSSNPVWVGLIGAFFGQRLRLGQWIGIPITVLGMALLSWAGVAQHNIAPQGVALLLASNFCWGVYTVLAKPFMQRVGPLEFTVLSFVLGGAPFLILTIPAWFAPRVATIPTSTWGLVLLSALLAQVIGFLGWFYGTDKLGALKTSILLNITPLVGVTLAALVLKEPITGTQLLAGVVILFGVWVAGR